MNPRAALFLVDLDAPAAAALLPPFPPGRRRSRAAVGRLSSSPARALELSAMSDATANDTDTDTTADERPTLSGVIRHQLQGILGDKTATELADAIDEADQALAAKLQAADDQVATLAERCEALEGRVAELEEFKANLAVAA